VTDDVTPEVGATAHRGACEQVALGVTAGSS
jgi:hypothetical protein